MEHLKRFRNCFYAHMCLYMNILPMDEDFLYEMEFHEMMSLNHFYMADVRLSV